MATDVHTPSISVEVLGPLRLAVDGAPVEVPGPKRRAVLALLALAEGRTVTADEVIDALWPSQPPEAARASLHSHISRLRGHLGAAASRLEAVNGGYRLRLERGELDLQRARLDVSDARQLADVDPTEAYERLRGARQLWRGPALADLAEIVPIASRSIAFDELRREVDDLLVEYGIAAGDTPRVVSVAAEAVANEPLREPAVMLLMRSLALTGRTAEALRTAYDYRRRLKQEAGLDPSAALGQLERELAAAAGPASARPVGAVPIPLTRLLGRDSEVVALQRLLASERLVTVVGPGGVGKTRAAIDVARRHDHARFVNLAPVTNSDAIAHALAASLELEAVPGDPLATCIALLAAGPQLLLLDNCEHVLDAVRDLVTTLLEGCPQLVVLATSRERLGVAAERQVRLGSLALPETRTANPERAPAVALFVERARRARPGFAPTAEDLLTISDIVGRLDGLPLAIELAAGRMSSLGLADLHARLDRALDLLVSPPGSSDGRHHTLRATIEWSYELLAEPEQRLFRHLAVFPDGVDLRTAEMVAADVGVPSDVAAALGRLVDASMLDADLDGSPRYRMLETVRSFGLDRLAAAGETGEAEERLIQWAVELGRWIDTSLHTADESLVNARLRRELPNLRAAWSLAQRHPTVDQALELVVALDDASQWRDLPELWRWATQLGDDPRVPAHPRAAAALATASDAAWLLGDLERAARLAQVALELADDDDGRWRALLATAVVDLSRADFDDAITHAVGAASLSPRPAHGHWVAALAAAYAGDLDLAEDISRRGHATSPTTRAEQEYVAGEIASIAGHGDRAEQHYRRAIDLAREVGATFVVGIAEVGLLAVRAKAGRFSDALRGYRDVIGYWERAGNWIQVWTTLRNLADVLRRLGDDEHALYLETAADHAPGSATVGATASRSGAGQACRPRSSAAASTIADAAEATPQQVLIVAREAIETNLTNVESPRGTTNE